jgi:4-diphosphocytidyl-2-C-methyl-D-erythritol kinase
VLKLGEERVLRTYAKVNLGLKVLARRSDGFHELLTLMHEVDLCDVVKVSVVEREDSLSISGISLAVTEENLLLRTIRMLRDRGYDVPSLKMELEKRIPIGGGLGGGSSNAVALLGLLGEEIGIEERELSDLAAELGSDTNFFIRGGTALCRGRGEIVENLVDQSWFFNLLLPKTSCSTPKVFSEFRPGEVQVNNEVAHEWEQGRGLGENDLLSPCCRAYPEMSLIFEESQKHGIDLFLSGSGSTCFTFHQNSQSRDLAFEKLKSYWPNFGLVKATSYHRT